MRHLDLFSGFGGFRLAVEAVWPESELVSFVEIDPKAQAWLRANWPGARIHDDADTYQHDGAAVFILTGGPPCQPVSCAGKQQGEKDDRWKWPAMLRIIQNVGPEWVVFENVRNLISFNGGLLLDGICSDMEAEGFEVWPPIVLPACSVNAPHRRDRVWIVAHSESARSAAGGSNGLGIEKGASRRSSGGQAARCCYAPGKGGMADTESNNAGQYEKCGIDGNGTDTEKNGQRLRHEFTGCGWDNADYIIGHDGKARRVKPGVRLLAHGFPCRNDLLRGFGNAIVPQVAEKIMRAIRFAQPAFFVQFQPVISCHIPSKPTNRLPTLLGQYNSGASSNPAFAPAGGAM